MFVYKPNGVNTAVIRPISLTRDIAPVQYWKIFQRARLHCEKVQVKPGGMTPWKEFHLSCDGRPRDQYMNVLIYYEGTVIKQCAPARPKAYL